MSPNREAKIIFSPLHGCGGTSVGKALAALGFDVKTDPQTGSPSGRFENITFNIANPEVIQSFDASLKFASEQEVDLIISSDPDADRIGLMVKHHNEWKFVNGNEIAALLTEYVIEKKKDLSVEKTVIKTLVTTDLVKSICEANNVKIIGDLLIGFKYIADVMNELEKNNKYEGFLMGCEESHGYIAGNYTRDKDAAFAAVWLAELAGELKTQNKTLIDKLDEIYSKYGFFNNYLTEVRMLGAVGKEKIDLIQNTLRTSPPNQFGKFVVQKFEDCQLRLPIVSQTDLSAKDVLVFSLAPVDGTSSIKVTVRPSGTEPKIKMYFEIGSQSVSLDRLESVKQSVVELMGELEKEVMLYCYRIIGVDFPDRGFLLFWQLPLDLKLKYFEIEDQIAGLKEISNSDEKNAKLNDLLSFLGSNPIEKVDKAFIARYGRQIRDYLQI